MSLHQPTRSAPLTVAIPTMMAMAMAMAPLNAGCQGDLVDGQPSCDAAVAQPLRIGAQAFESLAPAQRDAALMALAPMRDAMHKRCETERWTAEIRRCFATATTAERVRACHAQTPGAQATNAAPR